MDRLGNAMDLTSFTASFVDELSKAGVVDIVISPGSRSTPLAYLFAEHPELQVSIDVDERSAGFFALGMAKVSRRPTVLLCTSGTAAANYLPAVVEARLARVPLIVLTADRPHELRDVGAPQAIDQIDLFGKHAKWFFDMPLPERGEEMLRFVREMAVRAVSTAEALPAGAVHFNFPFREPLMPDFSLAEDIFSNEDRSVVTVYKGVARLESCDLHQLAEKISAAHRGIIVCGSVEDSSFVKNLQVFANKCRFPVLADPLSRLRAGFTANRMPIVDCYDSFLRFDEAVEKLQPELIIRFGAMPVSKTLNQFLMQTDVAQIVVDGSGGWRESTGRATVMVHSDEAMFCHDVNQLLQEKDTQGYLDKWIVLDKWTREILTRGNDSLHLQERDLFSQLANLLPDGCRLFVGNSMAIRDIDSYFRHTDKQIDIFCNRGANGIDGVISTALGVAAISDTPTYLVLGDLSFIHDLNSLVLAKMHKLDLMIVVVNNDGGGIFSFLPQASAARRFEELFGTPHGLNFAGIVEMAGGVYRQARTTSEMKEGFLQLREQKGLRVLEIESERGRNVKDHHVILDVISREIKNFDF